MAVVSAAVGLAGSTPAGAAPAPAPAAPAAALTGGGGGARGGVASVTEVTLVTGDRVRLVTGPRGRQSAAVDRRYARRGVAYLERTVAGPGRQPDLVVIPTDAAGLVGSGVLDENLFDVSELARDGYGDAARSTLPLIVGYRGAAAASARVLTINGAAAVTRALPSIGGAAVAESKAGAAAFWSALTRHPAAGSAQLALVPQVAKVWLDGVVHAAGGVPARAASAAESAAGPAASGSSHAKPAVGATSHAAPAPGAGVLVADLDTGYDTGHPDLQGVVAGSADFTGSPHGIQDVYGHGTWTASIIAGSGAASGGKNHGVAPGARLLVGKVLGDDGRGSDSQLIAGMQWAVAQHARIVNMSLGEEEPWLCPGGTDPLSQALDSLSASSGTLFVTAAGNFGPGNLESPGVATASLDVGAADSAGNLASFSATGPRCGDYAVKPDLTALGVGVIGARAAGTSIGQGDGIPGDGPVDANYTRASGTSGSTPSVTGSAAVLAQQHPDWTGDQLKAALTGSAAPAAGATAYQQGDGQVDLARAAAQAATAAPGSLAYLLRWPHTAAAAQTVTYHNDGTAPLTLNVVPAVTGADGKPVPAGMVTASPSQVTVAPGASTDVIVRVNPAAAPDGLYSGWLTAASPDGATVLRTAIGAEVQPQLETITFKDIDRNGQPVSAMGPLGPAIGVISLATGQQYSVTTDSTGMTATAMVPPGRYDIMATITDGPLLGATSVTLFDDPVVNVSRDMTITWDARKGVKVGAVLDRPVGDAVVSAWLTEMVAGNAIMASVLDFNPQGSVYVAPTARVTGRSYEFLAQAQYDNAPASTGNLRGRATLTYSLEFPTFGQIPAHPDYRVHDSSLAVFRPDFHQQGTPMSLVDESHYALSPALAPFQPTGSEFFIAPAGRTVTEYLMPGAWQNIPAYVYGPDSNLSAAWQEQAAVSTYRAGHAYTDTWGSAALGVGSIPTRSGDVITPDILPDSASTPQHFDADVFPDGLTGTVTLHQGTTVLGTGDINSQPTFTVPAATARYTLSATTQRNVPWSTLGTSTQATWTFSSGHAPGTAALPLWDVRVTGAFDVLDRAPAGRPFPLFIAPDVADGAPAARIRSVTVSASYDDGKTWHKLALRAAGQSRWTSTVTPPKGAAFVSLSASLTDAAGNSTQQTTIRAYQL